MIAYEDIGGQTATRDDAFDSRNLVKILLTGVLSVHQFQYLVASTLCREVNMLTQIGFFGNGMQDVFCHVFRV